MKLIQTIAKYSSIETLSLENVKLDTESFKVLCQYLNKNYSLKNLNMRQLNMPVREFAIILPFLAENRKLQHLNLSGNTLIDANADVYDLFPLEDLNAIILGTKPKDDKKKKKEPKKVAPPKDGSKK